MQVQSKLNRLKKYVSGNDHSGENTGMKHLRKYTSKLGTVWILWEVATTALMITSVIVMFVYGVKMTSDAPFESR